SPPFFLVQYETYTFFFFFQAEDGIRDRNVTGVQTCALPISTSAPSTPVINAFRPLITHSSPSCFASVCNKVGSEPAPPSLASSEIGRASCRKECEFRGGSNRKEEKEQNEDSIAK